jgi:hypothetical protein
MATKQRSPRRYSGARSATKRWRDPLPQRNSNAILEGGWSPDRIDSLAALGNPVRKRRTGGRTKGSGVYNDSDYLAEMRKLIGAGEPSVRAAARKAVQKIGSEKRGSSQDAVVERIRHKFGQECRV